MDEHAGAPHVDPDAVRAIVDPADDGGSVRTLLGNRNFRLFFASSVQSSLGDWAGLIAMQTLILTLAQGTRLALFSLGAVMMARLVPSLFIGPVVGVLADRYDRKRLLVFTDVARGVLFVGIAFSDEIVGLLALTFIVECLALLFASAKDAALPTLVDRRHLEQANQLNLLATYGTLPLGAVLAALMAALSRVLDVAGVDLDPARVVLLLNAASFLLGSLLFARLHLPQRTGHRDAEETAGLAAELRAGIEFIADRPMIRSLILGVVGVFFGAGVVVTIGPEFVRTELGRATTDWSLLMTSVGTGLAAGIGGVRLLTRGQGGFTGPERVFPWALVATGAIATVIATLPTFLLTLIAGFALGAAAGMAFVTGYTLLHLSTPDEVRARTFATFYTGTRAALFAALAIAPFLAGIIGRGTLILGDFAVSMSGTRIALLLGGAIALLAAVVARRGMSRAAGEPVRSAVRIASEPTPAPLGGVFVAFEGVEGAGKSTQVAALVAALRAEGHDVLVTREPGGTPVAEKVRQVLLDPEGPAMHPRTEALLAAAARAEHVQRAILPALEAGRVVVCDRYLDSSLAYQGRGRGLGESDVLEINRWAIADVVPDVVVVLYLDPEEGRRRVAERRRQRSGDGVTGDGASAAGTVADPATDRFDQAGADFHRRVADAYLELAARDPSRYVVVDAAADAGSVARQVRSGVHPWLPLPSEPDGADGGTGAGAGPAAAAPSAPEPADAGRPGGG